MAYNSRPASAAPQGGVCLSHRRSSRVDLGLLQSLDGCYLALLPGVAPSCFLHPEPHPDPSSGSWIEGLPGV
eukprot:364062-Chlamydomonas_euryale.AAC.5